MIAANVTRRGYGILGYAFNHMTQVAVVSGPKLDQCPPVRFIVLLDPNPIVLTIGRKVGGSVVTGSHESMVIIRGRIDQMAQDLLF